MFIKPLPRFSAKYLALSKETQMSFELATTIELKPIKTMDDGSNEVTISLIFFIQSLQAGVSQSDCYILVKLGAEFSK